MSAITTEKAWKMFTVVLGVVVVPLAGWVWNTNVAVAQIQNDLSDAEQVIVGLERKVEEAEENSKAIISIEKDIEYNYEHHKHVIKEHWNELYQCCPVLKHVDKVKFLRLFSIPAPWHQPLDSPQSDWIMSKPGW